MDELRYLGKVLDITITNPIGSIDYKNNFIYPVNYGYLNDNKEFMVYILGEYQKLNTFKGKCIGIIKKINEISELIVTNDNKFYKDEQIDSLIEFKEKDNYIIIRSNKMDNEYIDILGSLTNIYQEGINRLKNDIIKLIVNNIKDYELIEHLLDRLLDIPTSESERLYNFLCDYLENINKESFKFYKLEFKKMWD